MQVRRLDGLEKTPTSCPSTCSCSKKQSTKPIQTISVRMSYNKDSTLTPNSALRTNQIKQTPGNEFRMLSYSLLHTGSWPFLSHLKPKESKQPQPRSTALLSASAAPVLPWAQSHPRHHCPRVGARLHQGSWEHGVPTYPQDHAGTPRGRLQQHFIRDLQRAAREDKNPCVAGAKAHGTDLLLSAETHVFQHTCKAFSKI